MLAGMIARPRATSLRTNSGSKPSRIARNSSPGAMMPFRGWWRGGGGGAAGGLCAWGVGRARAGGGLRMLPPGSVFPHWRSLDVSAVRLGNDLHVAAPEDPVEAQLRQTAPRAVALWTARVVHAQRRLAAGQRDLPHRHADAMRPFHVHLAGSRERLREIGACRARVEHVERLPWLDHVRLA